MILYVYSLLLWYLVTDTDVLWSERDLVNESAADLLNDESAARCTRVNGYTKKMYKRIASGYH